MNVDFDDASMASTTMHAGVSGRVSHEQQAPPPHFQQQAASDEIGALARSVRELSSEAAVLDETKQRRFLNFHMRRLKLARRS